MDELLVLEATLNYSFKDRGVLLQALTRTSYGHEHFPKRPLALKDNERLEFLGDAILDAILSDILMEVFPQYPEGKLSKIRAALVNEKTLSSVALNLKLDRVLRLGKGEIASGGTQKPSILSSTLEALFAGIYLDGGFPEVYRVVKQLFEPLMVQDSAILHQSDPKTHFQEKVQARYRLTPSYHLLGTEGPDHAKLFHVEVCVAGESIALAQGTSKKEAEQNAARIAVEKFTEKFNEKSAKKLLIREVARD